MILDTLWKKLCFKKAVWFFHHLRRPPSPPVWQKTTLFHVFFFWTLPLVRLKVGRSWQFMRSLKMHGSREEIKKLAPQCRQRGSVWRDPRSQQPEISNFFLFWPSIYVDPSILCRLNEPFTQKSRPILNTPIHLVTFAFCSPLFDTDFFNRPNYHISFANCVKQIICSPP